MIRSIMNLHQKREVRSKQELDVIWGLILGLNFGVLTEGHSEGDLGQSEGDFDHHFCVLPVVYAS